MQFHPRSIKKKTYLDRNRINFINPLVVGILILLLPLQSQQLHFILINIIRLKRCSFGSADLISLAQEDGSTRADRRHMMIHFVHSETLFDIRTEVAFAALERARAAMILIMPVQIPFIRRTKVTQIALDHRHRMVFDVFRIARLHVRHIGTFGAAQEALLQMHHPLMPGYDCPAAAGKTAQGALYFGLVR